MRRTTAIAMSASALVLPTASVVAAATAQAASSKTVTLTKSFTGVQGSARQWGNVEIVLVVKKTTTTNLSTHKKTVKRRITSVKVPIYPNHTDRSVFINQQALPILIQETVRAQRTAINMLSGATMTSQAFEQSLQSAILKAKAW